MSLFNRIGQTAILCAVFIKELVLSSIAVARQVLGDSAALRPAIVAVPLDLKSRAGITTLANCCLLYTSPSPRDRQKSRMPSSA